VTPAGLTTLNKIAAGGLTPGTAPNGGPNDGKPKQPVTITQAVLAAS
jgi:hypothetical protein